MGWGTEDLKTLKLGNLSFDQKKMHKIVLNQFFYTALGKSFDRNTTYILIFFLLNLFVNLKTEAASQNKNVSQHSTESFQMSSSFF